jgi:hypothetical protein
VLFLMRGHQVPGTSFSLGSATLPGVIGMNIAVGGITGVTALLAVDREDGTLLRAKATPGGMTAYVLGKITLTSGTALIGVALTHPITHPPGWLQGIGQLFPMYWLGLGVRAALLPDALKSGDVRGWLP